MSYLHALKREIFIDIKKNSQKKIVYLILQDDKQMKVFEMETDEKQEELIRDKVEASFEAIMDGQKYRDITHLRGSDFLLFGIGDREKFESYFLLDNEKEQKFKYIALYQVSKKVKEIDERAKRAIEALRRLLYDKLISVQLEYNHLDIFLVSTPSFGRLASSLPHQEQKNLKQTIIHSMIEKIYDNMIEKRGCSNLRLALVLLKNDLRKFDDNIVSHLFYDIKNGVNLNREIINYQQPPPIPLPTYAKSDEEQCSVVDIFIKRDDENRFILHFLHTLLSMKSNLFWDQKKVIVLVSYICYILSTEDIKVTHRAGVEKIKIDYGYMGLVQLLLQFKASYFILLLEAFLKENNEISIEKFLQEDMEYHYFENKRENYITVKAFDEILTIQHSTLRQSSSRFFKNILIVGQFYKLVSQEEEISLIIASFLKKITDRGSNMGRYCQEPIVPKFLSLFLTGHNRKDCEIGLRDFFDTFRHYL